jgi:hypothetical protein
MINDPKACIGFEKSTCIRHRAGKRGNFKRDEISKSAADSALPPPSPDEKN